MTKIYNNFADFLTYLQEKTKLDESDILMFALSILWHWSKAAIIRKDREGELWDFAQAARPIEHYSKEEQVELLQDLANACIELKTKPDVQRHVAIMMKAKFIPDLSLKDFNLVDDIEKI